MGRMVWHKAQAASVLFGAGAVFAVIALVLPHPPGSNDAGVAAVAALALIVAIALAVFPARIWPPWWFHTCMSGGTVIISLAIYFWRPGEVASSVALLYVWVLLYAFYFFSFQAAACHSVTVGVSYAIVLGLQDGHRAVVAQWMVTVFTAVIAGMLIGGLVRRVKVLAETDALTGLANRRTWEEVLARELARSRRTGEPLAIALADVDNFKRVNDSGGHQAGDQVLKAIAHIWQRGLRDNDVMARYGGDEFAIVLAGSGAREAHQAVARLVESYPEHPCTVGVACWDHAETLDRFVGRADRALYAGKVSGRNRVVLDAV
jgi:diguanylate cyclase (GGDEF)-like protein